MKKTKKLKIGFGFYSQKGKDLFASVLSAAIFGMEVREIQVEADVSDGLAFFYYGWLSICTGERSAGAGADSI